MANVNNRHLSGLEQFANFSQTKDAKQFNGCNRITATNHKSKQKPIDINNKHSGTI